VLRIINSTQTKLTLRRDAFLGGVDFGHDTVCKPEELMVELERRNVETEVPLYIHYEVSNCWDVTFICTPGVEETARLKDWGEMTDSDKEDLVLEEVVDEETSSDEDEFADAAVKLAQAERRKARNKAREERTQQFNQAEKERLLAESVLRLCEPPHRLIITVEACSDKGGMMNIQTLSQPCTAYFLFLLFLLFYFFFFLFELSYFGLLQLYPVTISVLYICYSNLSYKVSCF